MYISYQPLWNTLKERGMRKEDLRLAAGLTTNMIANMGKGEHISMKTLLRICEALNCGILDVIELDGKRCGFSKRYFLVLVACRHLTCTKTECRKMFLSLIAPLTTIRLNRGKRSNRLPYIFAQGQER